MTAPGTTPFGRPTALWVAHESNVVPGHVGRALDAIGFDVTVVDLERGEDFPDPASFDLLVPAGSAVSAYDDDVPWLADEVAWLRRALDAAVPVFGICFGAQVLARVLGADVRRSGHPEYGWVRVETSAPELVPSGPWFQYHQDTFDLPTGATLLARNAAGVQAFRHGRSVVVQFHPEVDETVLDGWLAGGPSAALAARVDTDALRAETVRQHAAAAVRAHALTCAVWRTLR